MGQEWEGESITNRLGIWPSEDFEGHWTICGREDYQNGTGSAQDMVKLAQAILKNLEPGTVEDEAAFFEDGRSKPPVNPDHELSCVHGLDETAIEALRELARDPCAMNSPGQTARTGATLKALSEHVLQKAGETAGRRQAESGHGVFFRQETDFPFASRTEFGRMDTRRTDDP